MDNEVVEVMKNPMLQADPLLFGASETAGIVSVEENGDEIVVFRRDTDGSLHQQSMLFQPFVLMKAELADTCPVAADRQGLEGDGPINTRVTFRDGAGWQEARRWLKTQTGESPGAPGAPYLVVTDRVQQYLLQSGCTLFKGMAFDQLVRMQVDIECVTTRGYDFCSAEREGDRIVAIAMADQSGWVEVLDGSECDEKTLLERFVERVRERDPDVIEGHNIFNFDLPYIAARAARHGVKLALGRDGSVPAQRPSQFSAGERTVPYTRFDVFGRHVIDTMFLAQAYDVSHRDLGSFGLKAVAVHFGVAAPERTYVAGGDISEVFTRDPARLMAYVRDDVTETRSVAALLSRSIFAQAQMLPFSYQNVSLRGNAVKIDALMLREYLRQGRALPLPQVGRPFSGGYTDLFAEGVLRNVHHCDIRSLYPSLMLIHALGPATDQAHVFLKLLETLRTFRLNAKSAMRQAASENERLELDAMQTTFKILINSFYGYLGFTQARFNDFDVADRITREGRELLTRMVMWLEDNGAKPVEIDTDGIYYVPPCGEDAARQEDFRRRFAASLPDGIEIEFDGEYAAMFSYKMKNYALLQHDGEMIIKGAALKSRGLEPYQRDFMRKFIRLRLEGHDKKLPALKKEFDDAIARRQLPIETLARMETLSDSLAAYKRKREEGGARRAPYELALAASREYKAGDQVAYYVTGTRKNVAVHDNSKLVSDWDPGTRDENVAFYQSRLDALYEKLGGPKQDSRQGELF
jgi:DNA polymerase elongation subunit (family B)